MLFAGPLAPAPTTPASRDIPASPATPAPTTPVVPAFHASPPTLVSSTRLTCETPKPCNALFTRHAAHSSNMSARTTPTPAPTTPVSHVSPASHLIASPTTPVSLTTTISPTTPSCQPLFASLFLLSTQLLPCAKEEYYKVNQCKFWKSVPRDVDSFIQQIISHHCWDES